MSHGELARPGEGWAPGSRRAGAWGLSRGLPHCLGLCPVQTWPRAAFSCATQVADERRGAPGCQNALLHVPRGTSARLLPFYKERGPRSHSRPAPAAFAGLPAPSRPGAPSFPGRPLSLPCPLRARARVGLVPSLCFLPPSKNLVRLFTWGARRQRRRSGGAGPGLPVTGDKALESSPLAGDPEGSLLASCVLAPGADNRLGSC